MKIGIIREGKIPPDSRVPLTPAQCVEMSKKGVELVVQPSANRCYSDEEYSSEGISLQEDMQDCDILLGVKEVPIEDLIAKKTYFFFSHTIKEQAYNRRLLQAILEKEIRLIDYEVLTDENGNRVIAFGKFAGMVGAHNALWTFGKRTGAFELPRMKDMRDYAAAKAMYKTMRWPAVKIVLTGTGRVGKGSAQVLDDMGIKKVSPEAFINEDFDEAVYTQLHCDHYVTKKDGTSFTSEEFHQNPEDFVSIFSPFSKRADIMINGIYWDIKAPAFFSVEEMKESDFSIEVIADVTCDIAPLSSIPSTLKASTIADPVFGFDPETGAETDPFRENVVDMMTIDNLPNELPRDASEAFGKQFMEYVFDALLKNEASPMLERATITRAGKLTEGYAYLQSFVDVEAADV